MTRARLRVPSGTFRWATRPSRQLPDSTAGGVRNPPRSGRHNWARCGSGIESRCGALQESVGPESRRPGLRPRTGAALVWAAGLIALLVLERSRRAKPGQPGHPSRKPKRALISNLRNYSTRFRKMMFSWGRNRVEGSEKFECSFAVLGGHESGAAGTTCITLVQARKKGEKRAKKGLPLNFKNEIGRK